MHVACQCGEQFAVSVDRLPGMVRCPICERTFHVEPDGSAVLAPQLQPIKVPTICRCGQTFTIHADRFPHRVCCHVCGRHFNVLDTGQAVEFAEPSLVNVTTAIQPEPALPVPMGRSSAIVTEETKDHFGTEGEVVTDEDKRLAEVKLIDYMWKLERESYSLLPFFGLEIMPSKLIATIAAVLAVTFILFLCVLIGGLSFTTGHLCPGVFGIGLSGFFPVHLFKLAHDFEQAEAAWLRKRTTAIAKCESLPQDD